MVPGFKYTIGGGRGRARGRRASRLRRFGRAVVQQGRRRVAEGGTEEETVGQVVGEATRAAGRRVRDLFRRRG